MPDTLDLDTIRAQVDGPHVIHLRDDGWTIRHPLSCRPGLFTCEVNHAARQNLEGPPKPLGQYECGLDDLGQFFVGEPAGSEGEDIDALALIAEVERLQTLRALAIEELERLRPLRDAAAVWLGARRAVNQFDGHDPLHLAKLLAAANEAGHGLALATLKAMEGEP